MAQTTFAPIGAKWTYSQHFAFSADSALFEIEVVGDTVIQGRECITLQPTGLSGCMPWYGWLAMQGDSVLIYDGPAAEFITLYVFDAPLGSSWATIIRSWGTEPDTMIHTVTSTGFLDINGITLRTTNVIRSSNGAHSPLGNGTIVERLGDLAFLFPWIYGACDGEFNWPLRCYEDPDLSWMEPSYPSCVLATGIDAVNGNEFLSIPATVRSGHVVPITATDGTWHMLVLDSSGRIITDQTFRGNTSVIFRTPGIHLVRAFESSGRRVFHSVVVE